MYHEYISCLKVHEGKKACEICDCSNYQKRDLNKGVESVHEGNKLFQCDIFHYSCSQKSNMKTHVAMVHEEKKTFKCDICDYRFSLKATMNEHVVLSNKSELWNHLSYIFIYHAILEIINFIFSYQK